ncbi:uncharacterized protein TNCV_4420111 [Trichonephila clavipes]|nr:uncharacterized protein TNCV_4420111 [Trichonephila clavipes]
MAASGSSVLLTPHAVNQVEGVRPYNQTRTFPSDTKLATHWQSRPQQYVGTHFVKSISSGGRLLLSFKVQPMKPEYLAEVRNAIDSHLGLSGTIDENLTGYIFQISPKEKSGIDKSGERVGQSPLEMTRSSKNLVKNFHNVP